MVDITTTLISKGQTPRLETNSLIIETLATAVTGDTFTVNLATVGATGISGVIGFSHTTANSVIVQEQPTTAVVANILTITLGGIANTAKRSYVLYLN